MPGAIVDMHVHTVRGAADSSLTPDQLIEEAKRIGLSGVNISEHDRVWEARQIEEFRERSGLFVSRGMEVSTDMGHMIVIGLESYLPGIRRALGKPGIGASDCHSTQGVGCFTTVFEEELRDPSASLRAGQAHMLKLLHARRFQADEGRNVGEFRPYVEQALPAK